MFRFAFCLFAVLVSLACAGGSCWGAYVSIAWDWPGYPNVWWFGPLVFMHTGVWSLLAAAIWLRAALRHLGWHLHLMQAYVPTLATAWCVAALTTLVWVWTICGWSWWLLIPTYIAGATGFSAVGMWREFFRSGGIRRIGRCPQIVIGIVFLSPPLSEDEGEKNGPD